MGTPAESESRGLGFSTKAAGRVFAYMGVERRLHHLARGDCARSAGERFKASSFSGTCWSAAAMLDAEIKR